MRPITFFSWQGKKNAHKAKEESSKRSQRKREWEREQEGRRKKWTKAADDGFFFVRPRELGH